MNYLSLNQFLRMKFGRRVQKIPLDAGLSCPNRDPETGKGGCIYCNVRGSGTGAFSQGKTIREQLVQGMKWARKRYKAKAFIAYFQSFSNTFAPLKKLEEIYQEAAGFPEIVGVAIGTRPDCVSREVLELIKTIFPDRLVWMEYGLQSASDASLARINRGHSVQDF
ncbi:MAG: TIGR01212 family radical SAM protein, partial [Thermodesulfatator sp.]